MICKQTRGQTRKYHNSFGKGKGTSVISDNLSIIAIIGHKKQFAVNSSQNDIDKTLFLMRNAFDIQAEGIFKRIQPHLLFTSINDLLIIYSIHFIQMAEDQQLLLENLSQHQIPLSDAVQQCEILFDSIRPPQQNNQSSQKCPKLTEYRPNLMFYVDWDDHINHKYFTNISDQDTEEDMPKPYIENKTAVQNDSPSNKHQLYFQLTCKLELALNKIKQKGRPKEQNKVRSYSLQNRIHKQINFGQRSNHDGRKGAKLSRKHSTNCKFRTQYTDDSEQRFINTNSKRSKMDKYKTQNIISQQAYNFRNIQQNAKKMKDNFLKSIAVWQQKKQKRTKERMEKLTKLSMEGVTFTPEINARSRMIMKKKGLTTPIYERQAKERRVQLTERYHCQKKAKY